MPWSIFGPAVRGRSCGGCKACCTIVPVQLPVERKPANTRCAFQFSGGCRIYANRPKPCEAWTCKWLTDPATDAMKRPDKAGYIIDPMLDTVLCNDQPVEVVQIWCDPATPSAHRDPALRLWLEGVFEIYGLVALVRFGSVVATLLLPPMSNEDAVWHERTGNTLTARGLQDRLDELGVTPTYSLTAQV